MTKNRTKLVRYTIKLLKKAGHDDIVLPSPTDNDWLEIDWGYQPFEENCLYDSCDNPTAKWLLQDFIASNSIVGFSVNCELAKLLSKRGRLVQKEMDSIIKTRNWENFSSNPLLLSYLAVMTDGVLRAKTLLDVVHEDSRDGIFIACLRMESRSLDFKLMDKFREWGLDSSWGSGTGELGALHAFIKKWLSRWPVSQYSDIMKMYFERT